MSSIIERQRIRLKADSTIFETPRNLLSQPQRFIKFRTGSATQIEATHFFAGSLAAVTNFSFVTCEIKSTAAGGGAPLPETPPLAQIVLPASAFDADLTLAQFDAGTAQHFLFEFSDAEMDFAGRQWLLIYATTLAGNTLTLLAGPVEFEQDGGPSVGLPDPVAEDAWTKQEADARYPLIGATSDAIDAAQAFAIQRANHTGEQAISTVTGLQTALDSKPATTRTITAAGLVTGGGDLSADRTLTVTESADTTTLDETGSTTAITPRRWWQRLAFWLTDTTAKTINGAVTFGSNLTINGTDARIVGGTSAVPTPESVITQVRGDERYPTLAQFQQSQVQLIQYSQISTDFTATVANTSSGFCSFLTNTGPITAFARSGGGRVFYSRGSAANFNFGKRGWAAWWMSASTNGANADDQREIAFPVAGSATAVGPLTTRGIRVSSVAGGAWQAVVHDGTAESSPLSLGALSNLRVDFAVEWDGLGNFDFFVNGGLIGRITTATVGVSASDPTLMARVNNTTVGSLTHRFRVSAMWLYQQP